MAPTPRLSVAKTYKMFIAGAFPRSESGRSEVIKGRDGSIIGHACRASRKDVRDAVSAARKAQPGWAGATAYLRGQILYRMAEMLEGKRGEFAGLLSEVGGVTSGTAESEREIDCSIERLVHFAGWADKYTQVLGRHNAVAGPYWNITVPQPTGVIAIVCPAAPSLLALVSMVAPVICSGNAVVVVSPGFAPVVSTFGEVCATSDLPGGVVNLLTGTHDELAPIVAGHRDVDGVLGAGLTEAHRATLMQGTADNLKRVRVLGETDWHDRAACESAWQIEPFIEFKTVWHPVGV